MYIHTACINKLCFSLVKLSFVSLIFRAPATEPRRVSPSPTEVDPDLLTARLDLMRLIRDAQEMENE